MPRRLLWRVGTVLDYQNSRPAKNIDDELFVATVEELVRETKIVAYNKNKYTDTFDRVDFDAQLLRSELDEVRAEEIAEDMYWFAARESA